MSAQDALSVIRSRRVVRRFADRPVAMKSLLEIVDAGRHAMSARNRQPWRFVIVRDAARLRRLGELCSTGRFVADAPAAIVVLKDRSNTRWADIDCAHAVQNMANAAWAMGLGTCWIGNFDGPAISAEIGASEDWPVFTVLPFGYPDPSAPPQKQPLKKLREVAFLERVGTPLTPE